MTVRKWAGQPRASAAWHNWHNKESSTLGDDWPMNTLLLSMLGAVAEFERSMILERRREGIVIAKAAGKYRGRKASLSTAQACELLQRLAKGESVTRSPRNTV
jgi:DNA invertase Pin-like site-specific DNA recombinase